MNRLSNIWQMAALLIGCLAVGIAWMRLSATDVPGLSRGAAERDGEAQSSSPVEKVRLVVQGTSLKRPFDSAEADGHHIDLGNDALTTLADVENKFAGAEVRAAAERERVRIVNSIAACEEHQDVRD